MKTIILAAGYGTRLQAAIGDFPKPLVEVGGRTILDHVLSSVPAFQRPDDIVIVTNNRYFSHFIDWRQSRDRGYQLLNDGSTGVANRLGAIGDIAFAIRELGLKDDLLIIAADNILQFPLDDLAEQCREQQCVYVGVRHNPDLEDQQRRGVLEIDDVGRVLNFTEKPSAPASHWASAPLYALPENAIPAIEAHLDQGGNPDAPGYLIESLCRVREVRAWQLPGRILDIGSPQSLASAREQLMN